MNSDVRNKMQTAYTQAMNKSGSKVQSFKTSIRLFFETNGGSVEIDKTTLPVLAQQSFPVFLWACFDESRKQGLKLLNCTPYNDRDAFSISILDKWFYLDAFFWPRYNNPYLPPNSNAFSLVCQPGDYVSKFAFNDSISGTTFYGYIIISCDSVAYQSLLSETNFKHIITREILYISDNVMQYQQPLEIVKFDSIGQCKNDQFYPLSHRAIDDVQNDFINMKLALKIDRYTGIYTNFLFNTNTMIFEYKFLY
jgi:hypothetical protein